MKQNHEDLLENFKIIASKRWIEGIGKGTGNIGLTFEKEIGKQVDSDFSPDYNGIEIKCTTRFSRYPISLFSISFDGPTKKEIIRINELYGNYDLDFPNKKVLFKTLKYNQLTKLDNEYYLGLEFDNDKNKLLLCVYNEKKELIEKESYVFTKSLEQHLLTKLKELAIIKASKKIIDDKEYFRYYEINFYELKSFDVFLNMLINGEIEVSIISRINKTGITKGRYYNKNLVFQLKKSNIEKLFNNIYSYNYDEGEKINE